MNLKLFLSCLLITFGMLFWMMLQPGSMTFIGIRIAIAFVSVIIMLFSAVWDEKKKWGKISLIIFLVLLLGTIMSLALDWGFANYPNISLITIVVLIVGILLYIKFIAPNIIIKNKKSKIIELLSPYWKEYLKKRGLEIQKIQAQRFIEKSNSLLKLDTKTFYCFLSDPYYLSHYLNFKISREQTLKNFWRFSSSLADFKISEMRGILEAKEWDKFINEYLDTTLGSQNDETRFLVISEILKFI